LEGLEFRESCTIVNLGGRMGQRKEEEGGRGERREVRGREEEEENRQGGETGRGEN